MRTILCLLCLLQTIFAVTSFRLHGHVPLEVTVSGLQKEYQRIRSIIQPSDTSDQKSIDIVYYSTNDSRPLGVRLPEWGGGGAIGQDSIIIPIDKIYAFYPENLYRITVHELVHIALARAYHNLKLPRWFHEGMAMTLSGELSFDESVLLSRAITTRSLIPFDSIDFVNRFNYNKAQVAYCESHFAIQYMTKLYGYEVIPELLDSAKQTKVFDSACVKEFGLTTKEFESIVKNEMVKKYHYAFFFSDYSLFWIIGAIMVVIAFVITIIRNSKRKKKLDIEEQQDQEIISSEE